MTEIIINYPSKSALVQLATALGYYDLVGKVIVAQARLDAGGSYFFNNVGAVEASPGVPAPGLWARLRHNAEPANLQAKISASATAAAQLGITIYKQAMIAGQLAWTADGTTAGPAYLNNVGVIA